VRWSPPRTAEIRCNGAGDLTSPTRLRECGYDDGPTVRNDDIFDTMAPGVHQIMQRGREP
jgi:hypothetical protein